MQVKKNCIQDFSERNGIFNDVDDYYNDASWYDTIIQILNI